MPYKSLLFSAMIGFLIACPIEAKAEGFFIKPHFGLSSLGSDKLNIEGSQGLANYDSGFATGVAFGYDYANGWRSELDFEYRTNEYSEVRLPTQSNTTLKGGDFSSAILYLTGTYQFSIKEWSVKPFVGLGIGWIQEIDFDVSGNVPERSFSDSGDFAYRVTAGVEKSLSERWNLQLQVAHVTASGLKLQEEGGSGNLSGADYSVWSADLGLVFKF